MAEESMVCVTHGCYRDNFGDGSARFSGQALQRMDNPVAPMSASKESILRGFSDHPEYASVDFIKKGLCAAQVSRAWHESPTDGYERERRKEDADRDDRRGGSTLLQVSDEGQRIDRRYLSDGDLVS